ERARRRDRGPQRIAHCRDDEGPHSALSPRQPFRAEGRGGADPALPYRLRRRTGAVSALRPKQPRGVGAAKTEFRARPCRARVSVPRMIAAIRYWLVQRATLTPQAAMPRLLHSERALDLAPDSSPAQAAPHCVPPSPPNTDP